MTAETEISSVIKAFGDEKTGFGKQMNKPGMLSRTSKLLHRMKKEFSKLKSKNKKFGTIDNKKVDEFFNGNNQNSILGILTNMKKAADIKRIISKQTGKEPGDGGINFINDPGPAE